MKSILSAYDKVVAAAAPTDLSFTQNSTFATTTFTNPAIFNKNDVINVVRGRVFAYLGDSMIQTDSIGLVDYSKLIGSVCEVGSEATSIDFSLPALLNEWGELDFVIPPRLRTAADRRFLLSLQENTFALKLLASEYISSPLYYGMELEIEHSYPRIA